MSWKSIGVKYKNIKKYKDNLSDHNLTDEFSALCDDCLQYLSSCKKVALTFDDPSKKFFAWSPSEDSEKLSRAINELLLPDIPTAQKAKNKFIDALKSGNYSKITTTEITQGCYVISITFCAVVDLEKERDQKTPGTFFEYFIGHCYARKLAMSPCKSIDVLNLDEKTDLPTDFIFDLGKGKPKFHLPVKTSTRERVIQVWAHQRVLDGVYGIGRFWGTLVALAETKVDKEDKSVVEICLPDQWKLYQLFIAQMKRIYYLDIPQKYNDLNKNFPKITVKEFGEFFTEIDDLDNF